MAFSRDMPGACQMDSPTVQLLGSCAFAYPLGMHFVWPTQLALLQLSYVQQMQRQHQLVGAPHAPALAPSLPPSALLSRHASGQPPSSPMHEGRKEQQSQTDRAARVPSALELTAAVDSLYSDGLRPDGRILRKRLLELAEVLGYESVAIDLKLLRVACEACGALEVVAAGGANDWTALLRGRSATFVDSCSPVDEYSEEMWEQIAQYLSDTPTGWSLPGGRFASSQALVQMKLPFLQGFSLGQVCHIVQLAISQRKLLGYTDGELVPYACSASWRKDQSALCRLPTSRKNHGRFELATWETLSCCIGRLWKSPRSRRRCIPLSNIKHVLRTQCQVELSETALGYSKLSELFADVRLAGVCTTTWSSGGCCIVPPAKDAARAAALRCPTFGTAPAPLNLSLILGDSAVVRARPTSGSTADVESQHMPSDAISAGSSPCHPLQSLAAVKRGGEFQEASESEQEVTSASAGDCDTCSRDFGSDSSIPTASPTPSSEAYVYSVRHTFIHVALPSPEASGARVRAQSAPAA
mmetsp:Transcript_19549/g.56916  ORF Transcript_19549/g.56916 Transcript_19549/m.56916 type:complete len:527 (+) Transcript_19549:89-1669(+)